MSGRPPPDAAHDPADAGPRTPDFGRLPVIPIIAHGFYRSANPSGENVAVEREFALLRSVGEARLLARRADDLLAAGRWARLREALALGGSARRRDALARELEALGGALLHAHNIWPSFTYDLFAAARAVGLPTLQTLHNWRLVATNGRLLGPDGARRPRDARERDRLARMPALHGRGAEHAYRHALARWWRRGAPLTLVDRYLAPSRFARARLIEAGLPADRVVVKPNFVDHRGPVGDGPGAHALFVGRLGAEKGVDLLCRAWPATGLPLRVVGDGPLLPLVRATRGMVAVGRLPPERVLAEMAAARFLVVASTWWETFALVVAEAMACATPCLVADLGALAEAVDEGRTGRRFAPGDVDALARTARRLWDEAPAMRAACRATWEERWTPTRNLAALQAIYGAACGFVVGRAG